MTAIELKNRIPELSNIDTDDIVDNLRGSGIAVVKKQLNNTPPLLRLTLPFAIVVIILLLVFSPVKFMITGDWGYRWRWMENWFRAVGF